MMDVTHFLIAPIVLFNVAISEGATIAQRSQKIGTRA
jgi:hypothetical protein